MNYPSPKGGFEAMLEVVCLLYENGSQTGDELAQEARLQAYGYGFDENGETNIAPGGDNTQAYDELTDLLGFVETTSQNKLRLTDNVNDTYLGDVSGRQVADLLKSDQSDDLIRAKIAAILLRKLIIYDIRLQGNDQINKAFHKYLETLWRMQIGDTGRRGSKWGPKNANRELPSEWNPNKSKFARNRAVDLGMARHEYTSKQADYLLPVLPMDVLQVAIHYTYQYFKNEENDDSPELRAFYERISEDWLPLPEEFYEHHVLIRGLLADGTELTEEEFPILIALQRQDHPNLDSLEVTYLEAETKWSEQITASEFRLDPQ